MSEEKVRVPETEEERQERLAKQEEIDGRSVYVGNVDYKVPRTIGRIFPWCWGN